MVATVVWRGWRCHREYARQSAGRLDALSKECNRLLSVAAVIGRDFTLSVLERVAESPRTRILELLDEAASARVVNRPAAAPASYGFSHALIRETLYEELTTPVRVRLHRRVAEVLEELHGADAGLHLAEIAHHFFPGCARRRRRQGRTLLRARGATGHRAARVRRGRRTLRARASSSRARSAGQRPGSWRDSAGVRRSAIVLR
jgi:predicted ATPase